MNGDQNQTPPLEEILGITHGEPRDGKAEVDPDAITCLTCKPPRTFDPVNYKGSVERAHLALRMHVARVHTKTILTSGQKQIAALPQNPTGFREVTASEPSRFPMNAGVTTRPPKQKWSLARRRRFNAKKKLDEEAAMSPELQERTKNWHRVTPSLPEEALLKFCPCCGKNIERWL